MQMIRVAWPADPPTAETWERLRQRAPTERVFMTPDWLETWSRHLGSGRPLVFGVEDGGEVVALAPVARVWMGGLAVLRPLSVVVSLPGEGLSLPQRAMVTWFGIRGIGSVFYLLLALRHGLPAAIGDTLVSLTLWTVAASIVVHGISAEPLMRRYLASRQRARRAG